MEIDDILARLESDGKRMDLREYDSTIEQELLKLLRESQISYIKSTPTLVHIATEIKACDSILEDMGQTLTGFQDDLFTLSSSIETIQDRSHFLETSLKNRLVCILMNHLYCIGFAHFITRITRRPCFDPRSDPQDNRWRGQW
jgi:hypothetical protein